MKYFALEHSIFSLDWNFSEIIPSWWLSLSPMINIINCYGNVFSQKETKLTVDLGLEQCLCLYHTCKDGMV